MRPGAFPCMSLAGRGIARRDGKMAEGRGKAEVRLRRERRRALIERLNANDEYLRKLEGRRRETDRLSPEELELEIEKERNRSRRDAGGMASAGG